MRAAGRSSESAATGSSVGIQTLNGDSPGKPPVTISIRAVSDVPVVKVHGAVDAHTSRSLQEAALQVMDRSRSRVVIDLEDCTYLDSAGLGVFFSLVAWARRVEGRVAAVRPSLDVLRILQLVRLTDERGFQVFTDLEGAQVALADA